MTLPPELAALLEGWRGADVTAAAAVGGGCISNTTRVDFGGAERVFLKWARHGEQPAGMLMEEARSLRAMAATRTVRVPVVLACDEAAGFDWLLLEWLEPGPRTNASLVLLGQQLAALHGHTAERYGWPSANFIGSLTQSNAQHARWADFWRAERLTPQIEQASSQLSGNDRRRLGQVCAACADLLADTDADGASLLHGDLWSGNLHTLTDGTPAVIDPASYYGHREVDLAMARLFGGFGEPFFSAYREAWPLLAGAGQRLHLYQLYYLLVHVNLFGGSYRAQAMAAVAQLGF